MILSVLLTSTSALDGSFERGGRTIVCARLSLKTVVIEKATGPRRSDFRARTLYVPDRSAAGPIPERVSRVFGPALH